MVRAQKPPFEPEQLLYEQPRGTYSLWRVGANAGGEAILLVVADPQEPYELTAALFDAGFAWCASQTLINIENIIDGALLKKLFLTHSHYDHVAGAGCLKQALPHLQTYAHGHVARVLDRAGALSTMRKLNDAAAQGAGIDAYEDVSGDLTVDHILAEGDTVTVGSLSFTVFEVPGHTRDSLAFWCAQEKLLVSCETIGTVLGPVPDDFAHRYALPNEQSIPSNVKFMCMLPALTGYKSSQMAIMRLRALRPQVLVVPHAGVYTDSAVEDYFVAADFWGRLEAEFVMELHRQGCSADEIVPRFKQMFYTPTARLSQPEPAFDLNASYIVPLIIQEFAKTEHSANLTCILNAIKHIYDTVMQVDTVQQEGRIVWGTTPCVRMLLDFSLPMPKSGYELLRKFIAPGDQDIVKAAFLEAFYGAHDTIYEQPRRIRFHARLPESLRSFEGVFAFMTPTVFLLCMRDITTAGESGSEHQNTFPPAFQCEQQAPPPTHQVSIRTFGYFDVFVNGQPVSFRNAKSKELLALLVDRQGGYITAHEAISILWEDEPASQAVLARYRKTAMRLRLNLDEYGIADIVETVNGRRRLDVEKVTCDLFDFLDHPKTHTSRFCGAYLQNYSWGECTLAELERLIS